MRILISGASGFAGQHLAKALAERGHKVFSADISTSESVPHQLDICDKGNIEQILDLTRPDCVVLLSGLSSVRASWMDPAAAFQVNTTGALNLFTAVQKKFPKARFIFAGSAEEYGKSSATPLPEDTICTPVNPYALSKYSAGKTMAMMAEKENTEFIHLRLANHFGPGQKQGFVIPDFASQIAKKMLANDNSDIVVGNLEAKRDFLYIKDVIDAYIKIIEAEKLECTLCNIGSGKTISIREMLDTLIELAGISAKVTVDKSRLRSADTTGTPLDITQAATAFGWAPQVEIKEALRLTLASWADKLSQ